jgi:predicted alpha/beta superfamily hydrolase
MQMHSTILAEDREYLAAPARGAMAAIAPDATRCCTRLDGASQSGQTAQAAALLARIGDIPPLIVVGARPAATAKPATATTRRRTMRLDTDAARRSEGEADRFLRHLRDELIPRIERDYRTARPRLLAGWSRGGLFVVYTGIAAPALFDARFAHSPALWREDGRIVAQYRQALATQPPGSLLYLSLGDAENPKMRAAFEQLRSMLHADAPASLRWRADLSVGGVHESNARLSTPVGLCAFFNPRRACRPAPLPR